MVHPIALPVQGSVHDDKEKAQFLNGETTDFLADEEGCRMVRHDNQATITP
jgi:hypothetical protein